MADDEIFFHFRPDLMEALVQAIALLHKGKQGVLDFFSGSGVPLSLMQAEADQVRRDRDSISKFVIARNILRRLNELGNKETAIRQRREVARRIAEWHSFDTAWEKDQLTAKGAVSQVREIINVYDSFTRMKMAKEQEAAKHQAVQDRKNAEEQKRLAEFDAIKDDFYALFGLTDPHKRGKALEGVLNRLFKHARIGIREAFTVRCDDSGKPLEQIDGVVKIDTAHYLVEMKWENEPTDVPTFNQHVSRVFMRRNSGDVRGIFISYMGFKDTTITTAKKAKTAGAFVVLCTLQQLVQLMEKRGDLLAFFQRRITALDVDEEPFCSD
jgi:restriction system protein